MPEWGGPTHDDVRRPRAPQHHRGHVDRAVRGEAGAASAGAARDARAEYARRPGPGGGRRTGGARVPLRDRGPRRHRRARGRPDRPSRRASRPPGPSGGRRGDPHRGDRPDRERRPRRRIRNRRGRRTGLDDGDGVALPLRPGLVEHPGVVHDGLGLRGCPTGRRGRRSWTTVSRSSRRTSSSPSRDPDYHFVLAELDYLKPYFDTYPEHRAVLRRLLAEGRVELVGGTYNEPNTNLTSSETTIRNFVYGIGFQRGILGGDPQSAWQLDAFGHDPAVPGPRRQGWSDRQRVGARAAPPVGAAPPALGPGPDR